MKCALGLFINYNQTEEETMFPQQCFRNNVSPFAGAFMLSVWIDFGFEMRGLKNTQSYKQLLNQI